MKTTSKTTRLAVTILLLALTGSFVGLSGVLSSPVGADGSITVNQPGAPQTPQTASNDLLISRSSFHYQGKPIHPKLLKAFSGWLSDNAGPVVIAVDITAAKKARNEYDDDDVVVDGENVRYSDNRSMGGGGWFGYRFIGITSNGISVLRTSENTGGSGVFGDLLLVRLKMKKDHLIMEVVDRLVIGDRSNATITIQGNKVMVSAGKNMGVDTWDGFEVDVGGEQEE